MTQNSLPSKDTWTMGEIVRLSLSSLTYELGPFIVTQNN